MIPATAVVEAAVAEHPCCVFAACALSLLLSLLSAGPSRLSLYNVVLANFTLSSPGLKGGRVLWPLGLLPTNQQTDSAPRRLYLNDIRIVVSAQTIREYVSFLRNNSQTFYTVSGTFVGPWAGGSCGQKATTAAGYVRALLPGPCAAVGRGHAAAQCCAWCSADGGRVIE